MRSSDATGSSTFAAAIFDLDGTLVDSESLHKQSWLLPLAERGYAIAENEYESSFAGRPGMLIIRDHLGIGGPDADTLYQRVTARYWELAPGNILLVPGLEAFLDRIASWPKAVATSARRDSALRMLETVGLVGRFAAVVTADDITRGKPHREPFLRAAAMLKIAPDRCLAFEDSPNGLRAAHAAGMTCVGVGPLAASAGIADLVIQSYDDDSLARLIATGPIARQGEGR